MSASERLGRLLNLVPYLLDRPGVRIADAAADLGVSPEQLRDDLELLFVCGLPGYGPGDLIDMALDDDTVTITYDAGLDRPLRLTADEALALVVAMRALSEVPGLAASDALERALAKLETAAGAAAEGTGQVAVQMHPDLPFRDEAATLRAVSAALDNGRALRITYYTAGRDETTERVVDPMRLLLVQGRTYLEAWCRRAEAMRRFRLDRIDALLELSEPAAPPAHATIPDVREGVFNPSPGDPLVTLRLGRQSRWVAEYYPCEEVRAEPDGRWVVALRAAQLSWARRLVLGLGPDTEVLGPDELRDEVRREARAALAAYDA